MLESKHFPLRVAYRKTDHEGIYSSIKWQEHDKQHGITHEKSDPHKLGGNGVVERSIRTLKGSAKSVITYGSAPEVEEVYAYFHAKKACSGCHRNLA